MLKGVTIPRTGRPGRTGIMVTKTLLWAGERGPLDTVNGEKVSWFRSYDKATGAIVSEMPIPANVTNVPMTYMVGRQAVHRRGGRCGRQAGGATRAGASLRSRRVRGSRRACRYFPRSPRPLRPHDPAIPAIIPPHLHQEALHGAQVLALAGLLLSLQPHWPRSTGRRTANGDRTPASRAVRSTRRSIRSTRTTPRTCASRGDSRPTTTACAPTTTCR